MTVLTATEAKARFTSLVRKVHKFGERYVITHRGEKYGILLSEDDYEGLLETIDILQNRKGVKELQQSLKELERGETYSFEEVVGRKQRK